MRENLPLLSGELRNRRQQGVRRQHLLGLLREKPWLA